MDVRPLISEAWQTAAPGWRETLRLPVACCAVAEDTAGHQLAPCTLESATGWQGGHRGSAPARPRQLGWGSGPRGDSRPGTSAPVRNSGARVTGQAPGASCADPNVWAHSHSGVIHSPSDDTNQANSLRTAEFSALCAKRTRGAAGHDNAGSTEGI